ncbi:F0F1 ATP synthase subunit gamma, partial [Candidatus Parcubacteria bacterium]|nr:F0F1 ATP synthase subunit gamma [Candidatus Parcubacteria bacterium]
MESVQNLKKRIKSIGNINKITKAMELVAATKMRKAQEIALASRPYAFAVLDLLASITLIDKKDHPELMQRRKIHKTLFVLVASDKGLAGAFNGSIFKKFEYALAEDEKKYPGQNTFLAIGEKSSQYLLKRGLPTVKKMTNVGDYTTTEQVKPLADFLGEGYMKGDFDRVMVFSTHFRSALKQEALIREVLPISF